MENKKSARMTWLVSDQNRDDFLSLCTVFASVLFLLVFILIVRERLLLIYPLRIAFFVVQPDIHLAISNLDASVTEQAIYAAVERVSRC